MSLHCLLTETSTSKQNFDSKLSSFEPLTRRDNISACCISKQSTYHRSHMLLLLWTPTFVLLCYYSFFFLLISPLVFDLTSIQTLMLAWQLWIAAWMQPRLAMWMTCARSSAQNTCQLVSNPPPSRACATGLNAIRLCAGSLTASPPTTRTNCSSAPVRTRHAQSVEGRLLYPVALMKAWKNPAAFHRCGSAMLTTCAG